MLDHHAVDNKMNGGCFMKYTGTAVLTMHVKVSHAVPVKQLGSRLDDMYSSFDKQFP